MKFLFIIVNNQCNIACSYCFYSTGYQQRSLLRINKNKIKKLASTIKKLKFNGVILTGGEPLHRIWKNETYLLIRELKKRKIKILLNTSATFLNDSDLDKISKLKVDRLDISIDSHIPEINDNQRGRFRDVVSAINGLILRGYKNLSTTTVVTKNNASSLSETINWIHSLGISDAKVQRAFFPGKIARKKISEKKIMDAMKKIVRKLNYPHSRAYINLTGAIFQNNTKLLNSLAPNIFCCMGKKYFVCDSSGNLTPCFHRSDIKLGNLFNDTILEINSRLENNALSREKKLPKCFGAHCVSLFDNKNFWKKNEKNSSLSL